MNALHTWITERSSFGKLFNDYKGTDKKKLELLKINRMITEEQQNLLDKKYQEDDQIAEESREFIAKFQEEERKKQEQFHLQEQQKQQTEWEKQQNQRLFTNQIHSSPEGIKVNSSGSEPTQQTININAITNSNTKKEALQQTKQKIHQFLTSKKLKTGDLPKQYQNWKEKIAKLEEKEELVTFTQQLQQAVNEQENRKRQNKEKKDISEKSKLGICLGISGICLVLLGSLLVVRRIRKRKFKNKKIR